MIFQLLTLKAPSPKAQTSVIVVTVIETPACFSVDPSLSAKLCPAVAGFLLIFVQLWTITNISSIPIPAYIESISKVIQNILLTKAYEGNHDVNGCVRIA